MSFKPPIQNRRGFLSTLAKGIGVLANPDALGHGKGPNMGKPGKQVEASVELKEGLSPAKFALVVANGPLS